MEIPIQLAEAEPQVPCFLRWFYSDDEWFYPDDQQYGRLYGAHLSLSGLNIGAGLLETYYRLQVAAKTHEAAFVVFAALSLFQVGYGAKKLIHTCQRMGPDPEDERFRSLIPLMALLGTSILGFWALD